MADYRAINRNFKAVEQRKKLASTFSKPASKFTPAGRPGVVSTPKPVFGDTLAKIVLGPDKKYFGGVSGPISEATGVEDFINKFSRNVTVDTGDAVSRIKQDTFMGGKGKSSLITNGDTSLGDLAMNPNRAIAGFVTNNLINNEDVTQALAPGGMSGLGGRLGSRIMPIVTSKMGKLATTGVVGAAGTGIVDPDNAMAMNPAPIIKEAVKNKGILNTVFENLPKEIKDHLATVASKQNYYTARALKKKTGEAINKDEWFDNGVGLTAKDMWNQTTSFFKNSGEFAD